MYLDKRKCLAVLLLISLAACSSSDDDDAGVLPTDDSGTVDSPVDDMSPSDDTPTGDDGPTTDVPADDADPITDPDVDPTEDVPTDDVDPGESAILNGVFIDSAVAGVNYNTESQSGSTDDSGAFTYSAGEQITFSIGTLLLPSAAAQNVISPVDLAVGSDDTAATITNIARLLQSLDLDGDPDNGIVIPPDAAQSAAPIDFDVSVENFENDAAVINLVANSGSSNTTLISAAEANAHLAETLGGFEREPGDEPSGPSDEPEEEVFIDLRNSVWVSQGSVNGCGGERGSYTLTYSETGLATRLEWINEDADGVCQPAVIIETPEESFEALADSPLFLLTCGNGLCTTAELDVDVELSATDSRNDCVDDNGEPIASTTSLNPGTPTQMNYRGCTLLGDAEIDVFQRQ